MELHAHRPCALLVIFATVAVAFIAARVVSRKWRGDKAAAHLLVHDTGAAR